MTDVTVVAIIRQGVTTVLMVAGPMLGVGMIVGLLVSIFQATTQIQEQTLTFIPKLLAVFFTLVLLGPWMLRVLVDFTTELFSYLSQTSGW
ncbi:MAG: flagellar biosynthesis protein FliQ [Firmicutes bacterium]|nr:flagellar biosynthesis protein FliQ [Bacillota bacterium]